jgi:spermidine/putrescine transport system permease protein
MVLPIYTSLIKLDGRLLEASLDLGARTHQTFKRVILPLTIPGIMSGVTISFLSSATTIVISNKLGEGRTYLIGNIIEDKFVKNSEWGYGASISIILLIIIMVIMLITASITKKASREVE